MNQRTHSPTQVATRHQLHTDISGHGDLVQEGVADGHKAVIGHHSQQDDLSYHTKAKQVELHNTPQEGNGFVFVYDVSQHLGHNDRGVSEIHKGQVAEEEVHGGVESRADLNQPNHAQVTQDGDAVDDKKHQGEEDPQLRDLGESKEKELCDRGAVFLAHVPTLLRLKKNINAYSPRYHSKFSYDSLLKNT